VFAHEGGVTLPAWGLSSLVTAHGIWAVSASSIQPELFMWQTWLF